MDEDEEVRALDERLTEVERRVDALTVALESEIEELRRAVGRLDRAAAYCKQLTDRIDELERQHGRHAMSIHVAGGALMRASGES